MKIKSSGWVIYNGPSRINGDQIIAIITMESHNIKIGNMAQVWILPADIPPVNALLSGHDEAVCGECSLRQNKGGYCFVTIPKAPQKIWEAWKKSAYPDLTKASDKKYYSKIFSDMHIRFGAYGDPYALPVKLLMQLKSTCLGWTCYTHQWKEGSAADLQTISMASVDNIEEYYQAKAMGWRTFRVVREGDRLLSGEILCPEITRGITCKKCLLCNGGTIRKKNIAMLVHGTFKNRFGKSDERIDNANREDQIIKT